MVRKYNIPVATTLHGLGVIDEYHSLSLKMLGMHGSYQANKAVMNADLIILGTHSRSGLENLFMGNVAVEVVKHAKIPVLIIPTK